jgi:carbamoyltransferase
VIILGLNAYHGDSAACLVRDGQLIAAAEEERFRRIKHWAGLPTEAIRYCLAEGGIGLGDVDEIALNRNPSANLFKKITFSLSRMPSFGAIRDRLANAGKVRDVRSALAAALSIPAEGLKARIHNIEHHRAHLASAFLVSPFREAAVVSVDGFGDFVSAMWGTGRGTEIEVEDQVTFPHSLGLFYLALTQWLGFPHYGDEYKVMGLAPYGQPTEMEKMRQIVRLGQRGRFELDLDFFRHSSEGVSMVWESGEPKIGRVFSEALEEFLGPPRDPAGALEPHHKNVAASVQQMYEEAFFHLLDHVQEETRLAYLALAGGCAMNSVANGKVYERTAFKKLYVQSAAGDAGGAIGAAFAVWNQELKNPRSFVMDHAYFGPEFSDEAMAKALGARKADLEAGACTVTRSENEAALFEQTAARIAEGAVVGWFQGRMEWGPRALGNRSIVCDPRRADMKEILNLKIKRRESFRPFAPSILREAVPDWFETDDDVPFMLQVYPIRSEKRASIPAVTHVNGSGRLQTVTEAQNPRYYRLIQAFERQTGVPLVLNTSFNENEPVVCTPEEALDCFLRTKMDLLVLGDFVVSRNTA